MGWSLKKPGCPYARLNCPELWEKMLRTRKVDDRLKTLFREKYPDAKDPKFGVLLVDGGTSVYAVCFTERLEYLNAGGVWSFNGGEAPARKVYGRRLIMEH